MEGYIGVYRDKGNHGESAGKGNAQEPRWAEVNELSDP